MGTTKVILTNSYLRRLSEIEDFIWESSERKLTAVEAFLTAHHGVIEFLRENPRTPATHLRTGDQSWPFANGRYRLFFKLVNNEIVLLDLIDNLMCNSRIYPTFDED